MTVQALSPDEIDCLKRTASACRMSTADFVRCIIREHIEQEERKPFQSFVADIEEADPEESAEILALIDSMTEDDWETVRADRIFTA